MRVIHATAATALALRGVTAPAEASTKTFGFVLLITQFFHPGDDPANRDAEFAGLALGVDYAGTLVVAAPPGQVDLGLASAPIRSLSRSNLRRTSMPVRPRAASRRPCSSWTPIR